VIILKTKDLITFLTTSGFNVYPRSNYKTDVDEAKLPAFFIFTNGGLQPHQEIEEDNPTFQAIIEGKSESSNISSMDDAETEGQRLIDFLHQKHNFVIGSRYVHYCVAQQTNPIPLGLNEKKRPRFSMNFRFNTRPKGASE
jgi:hypothetical protein